MKNDKNEYDVITLRRFVETLWKNKSIIVIVLLIVLVIDGIYTFIIMDKEYESSADMQIYIDAKKTITYPGNVIDLLNNIPLSKYASINDYLVKIDSEEVVQGVIDELNLKITKDNLMSKINAVYSSETNMVSIYVKDRDPDEAKLIADTIAKVYSEIVYESQKDHLEEIRQFLSVMLDEEYQKQTELLEALNMADTTHIQNQLTAKANTLSEISVQQAAVLSLYETEKYDLGKSIIANKKSINSIQLQLEDNTNSIQIQEILTDNLLQEQSIFAINSEKLDELEVKYENINASFEREIENILEDIQNLRKIFNELTPQERSLTSQINTSVLNFEAISRKSDYVVFLIESQVADRYSVTLYEAEYPLSSNTIQRIFYFILGGIFGLLAGIMVALFKEYWVKSKELIQM